MVGCWISSIPFAFSPGDWIPAFHHHLLQPTLCCPPFRYLPLLPTHLSSQAIYRLFWGLLLSWQTSLFESSSCSSRNQPLKRLLLFLQCNQVFSRRDSFKIYIQRVDRNSVPKEIDQELPFLWNWFSFYDSPRAESATGLRAVKPSKMVSLGWLISCKYLVLSTKYLCAAYHLFSTASTAHHVFFVLRNEIFISVEKLLPSVANMLSFRRHHHTGH